MARAGVCARCLSGLTSGAGPVAPRAQRPGPALARLALRSRVAYTGRRQFGNSAVLREKNVAPRSEVPESPVLKTKDGSAQDASHSAFSDIAFAFE